VRRHTIAALALATTLLAACQSVSTWQSPHDTPLGKQYARSGQFYFLPRGLVRIVGEALDAEGAFKVTISRYNVPDLAARHFLKQEWNPLYKDDNTLEVTDKGLLMTTKFVSEDQTPAILDKVTETIINVAKISAHLGGPPLDKAARSQQQAKMLKPFNCSFDPLDPVDVANARTLMQECAFDLEVTASPRPQATADEKTLAEPDGRTADRLPEKGGGIFYRPPMPVSLRVWTVPGAIGGTLAELDHVKVPDPAAIASFPVRRPFLGKKTTDLVFNEGELKKVTYSKESEALAFVSIPASITAKVAEAIPAILTIQDARANRAANLEKARLDAEKNLLDSQLALLKSQQALADAQAAAVQAPSRATKMAMQIEKVEKMQLENEVRRLEVQKKKRDQQP
jgi:hypothetical protein